MHPVSLPSGAASSTPDSSSTPLSLVPASAPARSWPGAESDLRFYFAHQSGFEPLRSSFPLLKLRLMRLRPGPADRAPRADDLLDEARRHHRVDRVIAALDAESVAVLEAAFEPVVPLHLKAWGRLGWVIALSPKALEAHQASRSPLGFEAWLKRVALTCTHDITAKLTVFQLKADALHRFDQAMAAYVDMRRKVGRQAR